MHLCTFCVAKPLPDSALNEWVEWNQEVKSRSPIEDIRFDNSPRFFLPNLNFLKVSKERFSSSKSSDWPNTPPGGKELKRKVLKWENWGKTNGLLPSLSSIALTFVSMIAGKSGSLSLIIVLKNWCYIETIFLSWGFSIFSSPVNICLDIVRRS